MIDYFDDIFFHIKAAAQAEHPGVTVAEESETRPGAFPCVTIKETDNYPLGLDSAQREKYAAVRYRVRVWSNRPTGKRREAMALFQAVDRTLTQSNFTRRSTTTTPDLYQGSLYEITAVYEAVIGERGQIYTRG